MQKLEKVMIFLFFFQVAHNLMNPAYPFLHCSPALYNEGLSLTQLKLMVPANDFYQQITFSPSVTLRGPPPGY